MGRESGGAYYPALCVTSVSTHPRFHVPEQVRGGKRGSLWGRTLGWGRLGDTGPHCPHVSQRQGGGGAFSSYWRVELKLVSPVLGLHTPAQMCQVTWPGLLPISVPRRIPCPTACPSPGPLVKMRVGRPESESGARAGSKLEAPVISLFPPIGESAVAASPESSQVPGRPRPTPPSQAAVLSASTETPPPVSGRGWPSGGWGAGTSWSVPAVTTSSGIWRAGCESESACVATARSSVSLCVVLV